MDGVSLEQTESVKRMRVGALCRTCGVGGIKISIQTVFLSKQRSNKKVSGNEVGKVFVET